MQYVPIYSIQMKTVCIANGQTMNRRNDEAAEPGIHDCSDVQHDTSGPWTHRETKKQRGELFAKLLQAIMEDHKGNETLYKSTR